PAPWVSSWRGLMAPSTAAARRASSLEPTGDGHGGAVGGGAGGDEPEDGARGDGDAAGGGQRRGDVPLRARVLHPPVGPGVGAQAARAVDDGAVVVVLGV